MKNALILTGPPRAGKSHLLKWCMESWALSGARVRYIELHSTEPKDFFTLVSFKPDMGQFLS